MAEQMEGRRKSPHHLTLDEESEGTHVALVLVFVLIFVIRLFLFFLFLRNLVEFLNRAFKIRHCRLLS